MNKDCKGTLKERVECPYTFRYNGALSCAYCPFGRMVSAVRIEALAKDEETAD